MSAVIAFVGLGHMGGPMAANLVKAGHRVVGHDLVPKALDAAVAAGVEAAPSAVAAAAEADIVLTMLPAGRHVLALYQDEGLLAAARPGTLFVDCSTIDVADARTAHEAAVAAGHRAVDAPVSGGVMGAEAGTLTFMVGGDEDAFAQAEPLLAAMGKKAVHCGAAGAGQAAKICNNMILGVSMIAVSEAFVLGESLGLSHQALYDVASTASGQCWALSVNCPVPGPVPGSPANRDYRPGFAAPLMAKDLGLAANAVRAGGVDAELGLRAAALYAAFAEGDGAAEDFSGIVRAIRERSGQQLTDDKRNQES
ncbi:3-hydroxyisobutyrate dehydrogenase [Streptomyces lasiicapitis]|uniref:3-hydroxyisobutyrate dehydrogenase n=1 Tax=Streptomyces lasiicapitis TaxID=1923961 RepID=A0ABQ2MBF8_9ACTN|nr:3-hydroxyisobutyrate dehydrogenase [Streptomyces lasiicapitis]GGO49363.1 3-hydroxyisobutyrate dehydrogenase [Streptomyces lasiicapitis]